MKQNFLEGRISGKTEETHGNYEKTIVYLDVESYNGPMTTPVNFGGKKKHLANDLHKGQVIRVYFNVASVYWEKGNKYFINLDAWKVELTEPELTGKQQAEQIYGEENDLPF